LNLIDDADDIVFYLLNDFSYMATPKLYPK